LTRSERKVLMRGVDIVSRMERFLVKVINRPRDLSHGEVARVVLEQECHLGLKVSRANRRWQCEEIRSRYPPKVTLEMRSRICAVKSSNYIAWPKSIQALLVLADQVIRDRASPNRCICDFDGIRMSHALGVNVKNAVIFLNVFMNIC